MASPSSGKSSFQNSFPVMREIALAVWIPTATLVRAMRTFDRVENRGHIQVAPS